MIIKKSKIAVIGCGLVGSSTAFCLVTQGVCDEVVMIDINHDKALGEVMDLRDTIKYLDRNVKIKAGTYEDCTDVDIIVVTAGAPPKPGQTRLDTLDLSAQIAKSIVEPVMKSGFQGIFVVVSNPVDMIAYLIYKLSGLPKNQVIGTGTALDSARLQNLIGDMVHVDPRSVYAYSMGEHGDSQMVPWSTVTVAGKSFYDIIADNPDIVGNVDLDEIVAKTAKEGWEIICSDGVGFHKIIIHGLCRDDEDARILFLSELLQHVEPIHEGHHHIEKNEIVVRLQGFLQSFLPIGGQIDPILFFQQIISEQIS